MALYATGGSGGKEFEVPETASYLGVLADVADLGRLPYVFQGKSEMKITYQFTWVLAKLDGSGYALNSEGKPFIVNKRMSAVITEGGNGRAPSNLFKTLFAMTGKAPTIADDVEGFIGQSNLLYVKKDISKKGKTFGNLVDISALPPGAPKIPIPKDYVRWQDRPKQQATTAQAAPAAASVQTPGQSQPPATAFGAPAAPFGGVPKAEINLNQPSPVNSGF